MPTQYQEFQVSEHTLRYRPWSAFSAVSEWGTIAADVGDVAVDFLVTPGAFDVVLAGMASGEAGAGSEMLRTVISYLDGEDLGDRCRHYLDSCEVEIRGPEGAWLPLHGESGGSTSEALGLDGWTLLEAAWHVVREGLRPLLSRLASLAAARGKKSQKLSTPPAEPT